MKKKTPPKKKRAKKDDKSTYELRLYVTGVTNCSTRAIRNLKEICAKNFDGQYVLEIIDLYQHPETTAQQQIIAAPTLIRTKPLPQQRFVGDMSKAAEITAKLKE